MIIAGDDQYAAMVRSTCHVGMLEDVAAAVHAWSLAVPQRKHAVVLCTRKQIDLLCAPDAGGGEVFVHAWMKFDVRGVQVFLGLGGRLIDRAQG